MQSQLHKAKIRDSKWCSRDACRRGHPYTAENTYIRMRNGGFDRHCRVCERINRRQPEQAERRRIQKREYYFRKNYGMTVEQRDEMLKEQGGCKLCQTGVPKGFGTKDGNGWHIDHDHKTGEVRGILCARCNLLLGMLNDDVPFLESIIAYLGNTVPFVL